MDHAAINRAAAILTSLRQRKDGFTAPLATLPEEARPDNLAAAYAVQSAVATRLSQSALGEACGWKLGCTTAVMQDYLSIAHPCAGRLYRQRVFEEHATLAADDFFQLGLECEIAVWLRADITDSSAPFTHASVAEAVSYACVSIEIVEHRFSDFALAGTPSLIADDFFSVGCVHAAPMPLTDLHGLAHLTGGFSIDGASPEHEGSGAEILGHPLSALVWLAEQVSATGEALRAGQLITLGSVVKTIYPQAGTHVEARFGDMPSAHVHVT